MADLQFVCLGVAEPAAGAVEPWDVLAGLERSSRTPAISRSTSSARRSRRSRSKFAKSSGDKFAGVEWTPGLGNAPILADSVANFQCRAANRYYGGDHVIFLGAVEAYAYNRRSRCCLLMAVTADFLPLTTFTDA